MARRLSKDVPCAVVSLPSPAAARNPEPGVRLPCGAPCPIRIPRQLPLHLLLQPRPMHPIHSSNTIHIPGTDVGPGASPVIKRLRTLSLALTVQGELEMLELRILKPAAGASLMEKVTFEETCEGRGGWPCGSSVKSLLDRRAGQGRAARRCVTGSGKESRAAKCGQGRRGSSEMKLHLDPNSLR